MSASSTSPRPRAEPARRGQPRPAPPQFKGKYLSLTTFKRDRTGVATPVWFMAEAGTILVITDADSHKPRRIHQNGRVPAVADRHAAAVCGTCTGGDQSHAVPKIRGTSAAVQAGAPGFSPQPSLARPHPSAG